MTTWIKLKNTYIYKYYNYNYNYGIRFFVTGKHPQSSFYITYCCAERLRTNRRARRAKERCTAGRGRTRGRRTTPRRPRISASSRLNSSTTTETARNPSSSSHDDLLTLPQSWSLRRRRYTKEALASCSKLLEINPEVYTAWNYRKLALQHNLDGVDDPDALKSAIEDELRVVSSDPYFSQFAQ